MPASYRFCDLLGQVMKPICNYKNCCLKFSEHGLDNLLFQCHHPANTVPSMSLRR